MNIRRMKLFVVLLVTIVLFHVSTKIHCGGAAATARKSLSVSKQQQQQTPIKTFHTTSGDIIDCVDIDKQPAFDNPLLKNHKIEMNPTFIRKEKASVNSENVPFKNVKLFDQLQACPKGTVPIPRMPRRKQNSETNDFGIAPLAPLVRHYEVVETDDGIAHYGVKGYINVNNPLIEYDQWSSAQIWVQSGPPEDFDLIEAGWFVYPSFNGDTESRLYTSWKGIGSDHKDCINYLCKNASIGFVQIDPALYLGIKLGNSSIYGGEILVLKTDITRHNETGNWWLLVHDIKLGYWPKELFNHLATGAEKAGFGAVTGAPPNRPGPQMGNGHLPDTVDLSKCGFIARMKVVDIQGNENDIDAEHLRIAGEKSPCYEQNFRGAIDSENYQFTTTFGGPGGSCGSNEDETLEHLFFKCDFAKKIKDAIPNEWQHGASNMYVGQWPGEWFTNWFESYLSS